MAGRVTYAMSDEEMTGLRQDVVGLDQKVSNFAPVIPDNDRRGVYMMGNRKRLFVNQALEYAEKFPHFSPSYFSLEEFKNDLDMANYCKELAKHVETILKKLVDTYMAAGDESYAAARSYYHSVKAAAKEGNPGAVAVADELDKLLNSKRTKPEKTEEPAAPAAPAV